MRGGSAERMRGAARREARPNIRPQADITFGGTSSVEGDKDGTGASFVTAAARYACKTPAPRNLTIGLTGAQVNNRGYGGLNFDATVANITNTTINGTAPNAAWTSPELAGDAVIQTGGVGPHYSIPLIRDSVLPKFTHARVFFMSTGNNGSSAGYGYRQIVNDYKVNRLINRLLPGQGYFTTVTSDRLANPLSLQDYADRFVSQGMQTLLMSDRSHYGWRGITDEARLVWDGLQARDGGPPWLPPGYNLYSTASTAQTDDGFVANIPYSMGINNTLAGVTAALLNAPDFKLVWNGAALELRRATGTLITADWTDATLRMGRNGITRDIPFRILIGALTAAPQRVSFDGYTGLFNTQPQPGLADSKKLTIVFEVEMTDSSQDSDAPDFLNLGLNSASSLGVQFYRQTTGSLRLFLRNAAGTNITGGTLASSTTSTKTVRVANGRCRVYCSVDTTTGVQIAQLYVQTANDLTGSLFTTVPTAEELIMLAPAVGNYLAQRLMTGASGTTTSYPRPAVSPTCKISQFWCGVGYWDMSVAGNRNKWFDATTRDPLTLGTNGMVDAVTPFIYMGGNAADWAHGRNKAFPLPDPVTLADFDPDFYPADGGRMVTV